MKKNTKQNLRKTATLAMLTAIAVVSLYIIRTPLLPAAQFLEYDIADVPALIGAMLFGPIAGLIILVITSAIQALTVSASSGIIGFIMHVCASGVLILASGLIYKKMKNKKGLILGLAIGSILMVIVTIPLNLVFSGIFMGQGVKVVASMLVPVFIPFNAIKAFLNSFLTYILFINLQKKLQKSLNKD